MDKLRETLRFGGILAEEHLELALRAYQCRQLASGEDFLSIGSISREIGFVDEGIIRVYSIGFDGQEVTKYFLRAHQFAVDLESYYNHQPSETSLQAVVPTRLYTISKSAWNRLSEQIPNLYILMKSLTEATLLGKIKDNDFLNYGSAADKYREFIRRYPDLALRVPQQYIASYLKITPQSLSRIRRNFLQKG